MKTVSNIAYGLFITLLIGVAGLFLASLLPIPGNIQIKIVRSGSMEPTIRTGSIVIVKPADSYHVGDIITFGEDSARQIPTTHRIVEVLRKDNQEFFLTKGDSNEEADPTEVPASKVIGKVAASVPYAGYILDFARKPIGFVLLIAVPAAAVMFDEGTRIVQEIGAIRRRRREERVDQEVI